MESSRAASWWKTMQAKTQNLPMFVCNTFARQRPTFDEHVIRFSRRDQIKQHLARHPHPSPFHITYPHTHLSLRLEKGHSSSLPRKCHFPNICLYHSSRFTFICPYCPRDTLQATDRESIYVSRVKRVCV